MPSRYGRPTKRLRNTTTHVFPAGGTATGLTSLLAAADVTGTSPNQPPTAIIASPQANFAVAVGGQLLLDPTGTFDPEGPWGGTWTITATATGTVRFTYTGAVGDALATFKKTHSPTVAEALTVTWDAVDAQGVHDVATVTGNATAQPVPTTVTVSPNAFSLPADGVSTQLLTATVRDQFGVAMTGQTVTWSEVGVTVGLNPTTGSQTTVTAGTTVGTATITAQSSGLTGTSACTTTAISAGGFPNQPVGMTQWVRTGWNVAVTGTTNSEGWKDSLLAGANLHIVTAANLGIPDPPVDAPLILQVTWPSSVGSGGSTATLSHSPGISSVSPNTGYLYVSMWVYVPSNFTWNGNPGGKFIGLQNTGGMNNIIVPTSGEGFKPGIFLQNSGGFSDATVFASRTVSRDAWHQFEWILTPNTPGVADGTIQIAIDGVISNLFRGGTNLNSTIYSQMMYFAAGQAATYPSFLHSLIYGGNTAAPPNVSPPIWYAVAETYVSVK